LATPDERAPSLVVVTIFNFPRSNYLTLRLARDPVSFPARRLSSGLWFGDFKPSRRCAAELTARFRKRMQPPARAAKAAASMQRGGSKKARDRSRAFVVR
jgi:hypothetical protein